MLTHVHTSILWHVDLLTEVSICITDARVNNYGLRVHNQRVMRFCLQTATR